MWYVAQAAPGAELFVGLKRGVTRAEFERKIQTGAVAECFHRVSVRSGDAMFLPVGGFTLLSLVIFDPANSDDLRFDWNRPAWTAARELSSDPQPGIDFDDFGRRAPSPSAKWRAEVAAARARSLTAGPSGERRGHVPLPPGRMQIIALLTGQVQVCSGEATVALAPGQFCLVPASLAQAELRTETPAAFLRVEV
jgi:mannose-6-phosphate isomerase